MGESGGGCIGCLTVLLVIGAVLGTGYLVWLWIEPDGFLDVVFFLVVWAIAGRLVGGLASLVGAVVCVLIEKIFHR